MQPSDIARAQAAVVARAAALGLPVRDAIVVHNSNKLALRLVPAEVFARVAHVGQEIAELEVELALRFAENGAPVARLDPRVEPRVHRSDGFAFTLWTLYPPVAGHGPSSADYAATLERLHTAMRGITVTVPHYTDRVAEAEALVARPDLTPDLAAADRELLAATLGEARRVIRDAGAVEQLLHGEPHPGNLLTTEHGPLFIDLETCCRGPVEFDLAHVPAAVGRLYPNVDQALLGECRRLMLAMIGAWRWEAADELPDGRRYGRDILAALRAGPPWPPFDVLLD